VDLVISRALLVWLAAIAFTGGYGAGGMVNAALSIAVFTVVVGAGQMFVIALHRTVYGRSVLQSGRI
jgi:hypothetical protein